MPPCRHFPECGGCQLQHADDRSLSRLPSIAGRNGARSTPIEDRDPRAASLSAQKPASGHTESATHRRRLCSGSTPRSRTASSTCASATSFGLSCSRSLARSAEHLVTLLAATDGRSADDTVVKARRRLLKGFAARGHVMPGTADVVRRPIRTRPAQHRQRAWSRNAVRAGSRDDDNCWACQLHFLLVASCRPPRTANWRSSGGRERLEGTKRRRPVLRDGHIRSGNRVTYAAEASRDAVVALARAAPGIDCRASRPLSPSTRCQRTRAFRRRSSSTHRAPERRNRLRRIAGSCRSARRLCQLQSRDLRSRCAKSWQTAATTRLGQAGRAIPLVDARRTGRRFCSSPKVRALARPAVI